MSFDDSYKKIPDYFGAEPSPLLIDFCHLLDKTKPVLDIGAGQGRNSFFLARQGFTVDAIDPSQVGIDTIAGIASDEELSIKSYCTNLEDFQPKQASYATILIFGIIQVLTWDAIRILVEKTKFWIATEGLILLSAFSTEDPGLGSIVASSELIGVNSFKVGNDAYRTFLEPDQILTLFEGYETIHHWEGSGPIHTHGGKNPHRHAVIHAVFRR